MKDGAIICTILLIIIAVSAIGTGYAYNASINIDNSFDNYYCSIDAGVDGKTIVAVNVIDPIGLSEFNRLGFSSNGTDFQETLSLKYTHTKETSLILTIDFLGYTGTGAQTISCIDKLGNTIGSTSLLGSGVREGTITGIVLGFEGSTTGSIQLRFQVDGIATGVAMQMSFSVVPMEATS